MDIFTLGALSALVIKTVSVLKSLGKDWNKVITQAVTWGAGVGVIWLASASDAFKTIELSAGHTIGSLDGAGVVLAGVAFSSVASVVYDVKKALDATDSATEPSLLNTPPSPPQA